MFQVCLRITIDKQKIKKIKVYQYGKLLIHKGREQERKKGTAIQPENNYQDGNTRFLLIIITLNGNGLMLLSKGTKWLNG